MTSTPTRVLALVRAWLLLDFFGESRRGGDRGSTLTTTIFGQSFLGLVFASLLLPDRHGESSFVAYAAANLSLSMLLMGIGVLGDPARLQRARADELLVRTAPVGRGALALARAVHGGFSLSLVTIGIALPPAILSYWVAGGRLAVVPAYLLVACCLSAVVAGTLSLAVQAASRVLGPARGQLVGATGRGVLLAAGFVGFALCLRHLDGTADDLPFGRWGARLWPGYWGARVLDDPVAAWPYALALLAAGLSLYAGSCALQRSARPVASRGVGVGWLCRLDRRIARGGPLLGITAFTSAMLYRSAGFRAKVLPILGMPAAMVGLAVWEAEPAHRLILLGITLQFPTIYLPLLVAFLPAADEARTSWVFATSPPGRAVALARQAALISLTTHVLLPAQLAAALVLGCSDLGWSPTLALTSFSLGTGVLAASLVLRGLPCVPFTDEAEGVSVDAQALMALALAMGVVGGAFAVVAAGPAGLVLGLAALGGGGRRLLRRAGDG